MRSNRRGAGGPGPPRPDGGAPPLFEALPDPAVRYADGDGAPVVRAVNPAFEAAFGVDGGDAVDGPLDAVLPGCVTDRGFDPAGADPTAVRCGTADGDRRFLVRSAATDGGGYVILTDVTPAVEDLERENERLGEFASVVSHDLRNPLEVAEIRLELARETGEDVHFEKIADAHDRIERIVEDVLSLALSGEVIDEATAVDLDGVVESAWSTVETGDATLVVADGLPTVEADAGRLRSLLENLFRNAVVHAGPGVTVEVGPLEDGFYVEDDGPGVPEGDRERVFEPGYSTSEGSTGLGLAIVERIADAHGWEVSIVPADGARFEVTGVDASRPPRRS